MAATVQHGQLYGMWQYRTLVHKMASTVQREATARHEATHNTVAYKMAAIVQHEAMYSMQQHITL